MISTILVYFFYLFLQHIHITNSRLPGHDFLLSFLSNQMSLLSQSLLSINIFSRQNKMCLFLYKTISYTSIDSFNFYLPRRIKAYTNIIVYAVSQISPDIAENFPTWPPLLRLSDDLCNN